MKAKDHIRWSETLKEAVERCCWPDDTRPQLRLPWVQGEYLYASNGRIMVRLSSGAIQTTLGQGGHDGEFVIASATPTDWVMTYVPHEDLLSAIMGVDWVQESEAVVCDRCGGTKLVECPECGSLHDCGMCEGTGFTGPAHPGLWHYAWGHYVQLFGAWFDPNEIERVADLARISGRETVGFLVPVEPAPNRPIRFHLGDMAGVILPAGHSRFGKADGLHPVPGYSDHPAQVQANG